VVVIHADPVRVEEGSGAATPAAAREGISIFPFPLIFVRINPCRDAVNPSGSC